MEELGLRGSADVDLPVTQSEKPGATALGTVRLQNCTFKHRYEFENVSGVVTVDKGR